jgi:hypothetical protein
VALIQTEGKPGAGTVWYLLVKNVFHQQDAAAADDEQYRLAALEGMRDYIDRLSGEYKENAESSTLINYEQASNAQCRIFAAKPLWSAAVRHRTDWLCELDAALTVKPINHVGSFL